MAPWRGPYRLPFQMNMVTSEFRFGRWGNYTLTGSKEEDGYPLTVSGFHQQVSLDQIPKLTFTECKVVTDVVQQLGQKAPMIEGGVTDHVTGQKVKRATITLSPR